MKTIFIALILIFILTGASFAKVEKSYYDNGQVKEYHEVTADGMPDGMQIYYFYNGQLETKGKCVMARMKGYGGVLLL